MGSKCRFQEAASGARSGIRTTTSSGIVQATLMLESRGFGGGMTHIGVSSVAKSDALKLKISGIGVTRSIRN